MKIDTFARAYIDCALWSSTDGATESGGEQLDENYTVDDIAPATLARMVDDCAAFQRNHADDLDAARIMADAMSDRYAGDERNGHDFWLTRNRHGAGYWARGYAPALSQRLTDAAHAWGPVDLYVADEIAGHDS